MRLLLILLISVLVGCTSAPSDGDLDTITQQQVDELLDVELKRALLIDVESKQDIFYISEQQKQDFLSNFHNIKNKNTYPNRRISRFLSHRLEQFTFHANTLTASQSLSNNQGNCLSLAILTKALADISDVEVKFELVRTPPVYQRSNGLLMKSQHHLTVCRCN